MPIAFERLIPQHYCSRLIGRITKTRNKLIKNLLIKAFVKHYHVDLQIAERDSFNEYEHFNDFFTRKLKSGARPIASGPTDIVSPVDGALSEFGDITRGRLFQAKNVDYSLEMLLANRKELTNTFNNGYFMTFYLSPKDYHRVHMPLDGQLKEMIYVPGSLLSVNRKNTETIPTLYAKNERVVCIFDTEIGPVGIVFVGAIFVGSISTVWAGEVTPPYGKAPLAKTYSGTGPHSLTLKRGEEIGHFNMGSTIIMLLPETHFSWRHELNPHENVRVGECMLKYNYQKGVVI